jgi:SWI/SNF-related matrix-associated actin-dependent regulator 1 of chromatin subfamily A
MKKMTISNLRTLMFACGHMRAVRLFAPEDYTTIKSSDNKTMLPYQLRGSSFLQNSGMRALLADECGLGKTLQVLATLKNPDNLPALVLCKSTLKLQWFRETIRWVGLVGQIIEGEHDHNLGCKICFLSVDLLVRFKNPKKFAQRFGIQTVIFDECQAIKNHESKRTNAVRVLMQDVPNMIAMSGTPIKNNAEEFFPILNILRPDKFPSLTGFYNNWVASYYTEYGMKSAGISNPKAFKEFTQDFILRRTRAEILTDLPKIQRTSLFVPLGKKVQADYDFLMKSLAAEADNFTTSAFQRQANILAYLGKMRHLTGMAKIAACADHVEEFLEESDRKIVIFTHHKDVMNGLHTRIAQFHSKVLTFESHHSNNERSNIINKFVNDGSVRVLIASTLAAGEGVDGLQKVCSDILILERQWNPANEEQVEGRVERMGQESNRITATYLIATGTIDEYFAQLVEQKRANMASTLDGKEIVWNESDIMRELVEELLRNNQKRWKL